MSTKFEQLLDLLVNEDMEGANALFHEIVVEKSRTIYENLIAEEEDEEMDESAEDEEMDESKEEDEEEMDESREEDEEEMDEARDEEMEDSYMMDGDETGDATDDFGGEISADGDNFDAPEDDEHDHEGQEDSAIMDIKNAIAELEAAFAELEAAQGDEEAEMGAQQEPTPGYEVYEENEKGHWIQKAVDPKHKGALHKALHVAKDKDIPASKLNKATHSKDAHLRHMAQFAKNVQK